MGPSEPEGPFLPEHGRISVPVGVIGVQVAAELLETADGALLGPLHQREAVKVWTAPSFITQRKRHSTMVASSRWKKRPLSQTSTRPRVFHSWNQ